MPVSTEIPRCLLCQSERFEIVLSGVSDQVWKKPGAFDIRRCERCGLVITSPRPTKESLAQYYEKTYAPLQKGRRFQVDSPLGRLIPKHRLDLLERAHPLSASDRLLDVGCGYGAFLHAAKLRAGCRTAGIDLDPELIADALDRDTTEYQVAALESAAFEAESFTVVTFYESLEHHMDPLGALKRAHGLLSPGGHVVVEAPNFASFWRHVFRRFWLPLLIPQHLVHFTPKTLENMLQAAGFSKIAHAQAMFYPLEGIASFFFWMRHALRIPPRGTPSWRRSILPFLLLFSLLGFFVVELPTQAILRILGLSGHQTMIARK